VLVQPADWGTWRATWYRGESPTGGGEAGKASTVARAARPSRPGKTCAAPTSTTERFGATTARTTSFVTTRANGRLHIRDLDSGASTYPRRFVGWAGAVGVSANYAYVALDRRDDANLPSGVMRVLLRVAR